MKLQSKRIKVHKLFIKLFGRETTLLDLLAIFAGSVSFTIVILPLVWEPELSLIKKIVLTILALDIGGGVVANYTEGTNNYYAETSKHSYLFVLFHILQPLLLAWIYPINLYFIFTITTFTLMSSVCIINIKEFKIQRVIAAMLLLIGIVLIQSLNLSNQLLQLIMLVYSTKLILAFSVNWTGFKKYEIDRE